MSRRGLIRGAAVGGVVAPVLAACGGSEGTSGTEGTSGSASTQGTGGATVPAGDVPVGGGTILEDELVVVTQPSEGEFRAFSAVCTHQGCPVQAVTDGRITCNCHGSEFSIEDGSVLGGPAATALPSKAVEVDGDSVRVS